MTLKEAKEILKKEGFCLEDTGKPHSVSEDLTEFESPDICEAMQIVCSAGYSLMMLNNVFNARKARLKEEYEKNTKAPGPGEEQPKEGNPALKEAASQFNDALLDEQAKKIEELTKEKVNLEDLITILDACKKHNDSVYQSKIKSFGKEIARLNKAIHKKNMKIEEFRKESSKHLRGKIKVFYENRDLEGKLKDKDAVLSDVAEELRLTKIREKNLAELGLKYVGENEKLKKELADKVVDKIDAQALKSAESALACKEQLIYYKDKIIANNKKKIAEKDEVIADLGKELEEKIKLVETVRNASKQYCEYGIAAEKMIQKMANVIVYGRPVSSEDFKEYRRWANGYRYNPQLSDFIEEEEKKLTAKTLDFNAKCMKAARESINDVFESYAAKYAKSSLDDLKEKAYNSFNAKACKLGLVGSKDRNGILDQMAGVDIAEEGGDQSATIVQCGNDITLSKEEAEIVERCTKNCTELHYSEKDGLTYTNVFGEEMPISCLRGMFQVFTDEEIKNMKK